VATLKPHLPWFIELDDGIFGGPTTTRTTDPAAQLRALAGVLTVVPLAMRSLAWPASAQTPPGGAAKPLPAAAGLPAAARPSPEPGTASPAVVKLAGMPDIEFYPVEGRAMMDYSPTAAKGIST